LLVGIEWITVDRNTMLHELRDTGRDYAWVQALEIRELAGLCKIGCGLYKWRLRYRSSPAQHLASLIKDNWVGDPVLRLQVLRQGLFNLPESLARCGLHG